VALFEPYSAFGRMAASLFSPLYRWSNNLLAWISEKMGNFVFYTKAH